MQYFIIQSPAESGESLFGRDYEVHRTGKKQPEPCDLRGWESNQRLCIYIEDVEKAIFNTMENKKAIGEIFNIGTGKPIRIKELAEIIIKISNRKLEPEFAPAQIGDIRESYADITKAKNALVYQPRYTLERGLELCLS